MSSSSSHDSGAPTSSRNHSLLSCSKTVQLSSAASAAAVLGPSPVSSALSTGNVHCSIGQQSSSSGGAGLGPIMEIREMNSYCNSCVTVGADKYWNHHPHDNVSRLTAAVYPQMFYTPPPPSIPTAAGAPPPPGNYATTSSSCVPTAPSANDWACPPSTADSYSHYIYSQYHPPPPPPQHHDYSNFLGISTSCYESDMMMMGGVAGATASQQGPSSCEASATQAMMNSFMYPAPLPPPLTSFESVMALPSVTAAPQQPSRTEKVIKANPSFSPSVLPAPAASPPSTASSTSSGDSIDDTDEEDDDSRHIISIEDDENDAIDDQDLNSSSGTEESTSTTVATSLCVLCRKPAPILPVLPPNAPSPQLSRILDNIDDDELDISVCSGDIEIGGIEDEMIQQASEQQQQTISLLQLSKLLGVPYVDFLSNEQEAGKGDQDNTCQNAEQVASLCSKCQKLVGMAESLEKQFISVLTSLRQVFSLEDDIVSKISCASLTSVGTQTDICDVEHQNGSILVRRCSAATSSSTLPDSGKNQPPSGNSESSSTTPTNHSTETANDSLTLMALSQFLCHVCGQHFNCSRNLGKHIKRHHRYRSPSSIPSKSNDLPTCPRENCGKTFSDRAALRVHLRKHTSEKPFFCVDCLKLFTTKSNLTAHIKSGACRGKVPTAAVESQQQLSELSTQSPSSLNSPRDKDDTDTDTRDFSPGNTKTEENSGFRCENCGLTFRTESRFQKHINSNSTPSCSKSNLFKCDICPRLFAKRSELQTHQAVHTRQKPFQCDICGIAFSTRGNQRVHQRGHFNQKRFKCQHCDKSFTRNQTLQTHIANVHK